MGTDKIRRRESRTIKVGGVAIGGGAPIAVQSMTNTRTADVKQTLAQMSQLEAEGCEIVRVSVPDKDSARAISAIKEATSIPVVADVHFQAELAMAAITAGADKIRINPGNIGGKNELLKVVEAAGEAGIPIRVGVNSGSLGDEIRLREAPMADKLVASAMRSVSLLEDAGFRQIVISVKSSTVLETVAAYRKLAGQLDYPLHLGITESGTLVSGCIKSAVGLGILLAEGIGDTLRVSLTADPVEEIRAGQQILQALEIRLFRPELISCPTCARCEVDLIKIASEVETRLMSLRQPCRVAVMGCVVNGPGEASHADIGIAAGQGKGVLFKRGQKIGVIPEDRFVDALFEALDDEA